MRVKVHAKVSTLDKETLDRKEIQEQVRDVIYNQLVTFENNKNK
jgi:1-acyl-sn-glycerol-3-phosphate acyltransferase